MFKTFLIYITTFILTGAIISPVVFDVLNINEEMFANEFCEEDTQERKKELELKDLFFKIEIIKSEAFIFINQNIISFYLIKKSIFKRDIISPPPEF